jgi:hypothetical protein
MKTLTAICLGVLSFAASAFAQCSNSTLMGAYAYSVDVVTTVDGKTVTNSDVGRLVFDGAGRYTVRVASTVNGETTIGEGAGEYLLGSDCTMTGKGDGVEFDGVVVNGGSDFAIIVREPGLSRSGSGTRIEGQACSAEAIAGAFGYAGQGSTSADGRVFSLSEVGVLTFSGDTVAGVYSASSGGLVERREFSGTFAVNADCTGTAEYKVGETAYVMNFVVASQTNTLYYSESGSGSTITGVAGRISPK